MLAPAKLRAVLKKLPGLREGYYALARPLHVDGGFEDQWARIVMNRETHSLIRSTNPEDKSVLEISGDSWRTRAAFARYRSVNFSEYDVCAGPLHDEKFDIVIAEQVFEHLLWPYRAVRHVHQMLKPGGTVLLTMPFLIKVHNVPTDCSRWTETGIRHLLAEGGFDINLITTGSWGNRACVRANWRRWQIYQSWRHSLKNEPDFPVVIWAMAKK
jgi:SAM-dependent methyltransferase